MADADDPDDTDDVPTCSKCHKSTAGTPTVGKWATNIMCVPCHTQTWVTKSAVAATKPLEFHLRKKVKLARRRERYRKSVGPTITLENVTDAWHRAGERCEHCAQPIQLTAWNPKAPPDDFAVLDRIDGSSNRTYGDGNARFLCWGCNQERTGWEVALDMQKKLEACQLKSGLTGGGAPVGAARDAVHQFEAHDGNRCVDARRRWNQAFQKK